jgi:hypothetical protein
MIGPVGETNGWVSVASYPLCTTLSYVRSSSRLNFLYTTVTPRMLSATRHVVRSSLSLRVTSPRRPATVNLRPTGMWPSGFTIRTLISKFSFFWGALLMREAISAPGRLWRTAHQSPARPQLRNTRRTTKLWRLTIRPALAPFRLRITLRAASEMSSSWNCQL